MGWAAPCVAAYVPPASLANFLMMDLAKFSLISVCRGTGWDCLVKGLVYQS